MAQTCFGLSGGFAPVSFPLFQGIRFVASVVESKVSCMVVLLCYRGRIMHRAFDVGSCGRDRGKTDELGSLAPAQNAQFELCSGTRGGRSYEYASLRTSVLRISRLNNSATFRANTAVCAPSPALSAISRMISNCRSSEMAPQLDKV